MNIPIYRAKKIDGDEWVEGYLVVDALDNKPYIWLKFKDKPNTTEYIKSAIDIDPNTLSINFPNMIDKNGKKIFASLSKNSIGGDRLKDKYGIEFGVAVFGTYQETPQSKHDRPSHHTGCYVVNGVSKYSLEEMAWYMDSNYHPSRTNNIEVIGIYKG